MELPSRLAFSIGTDWEEFCYGVRFMVVLNVIFTATLSHNLSLSGHRSNLDVCNLRGNRKVAYTRNDDNSHTESRCIWPIVHDLIWRVKYSLRRIADIRDYHQNKRTFAVEQAQLLADWEMEVS
jgi:hypothetical protein